MKCEYCGQETQDGLDFCTKCGRVFKRCSAAQKKSKAKYIVFTIILLFSGVTFLVYFSLTKLNQSAKRYNEGALSTALENEDISKKSSDNDIIYTVVENPRYNVLENQKYGVHIEYPEHFIVSNTKSDMNILDLKDPNNAAKLCVYGFLDISIASENLSDLIESVVNENGNATLLDEKCTSNRIYKKHRIDSTIIQTSCIISDNSICVLEFIYAEFEAHVYDRYFKYIDEHFKNINQ